MSYSVRVASQVEALRRALGARVMHVHLSAPEQELTARYERRRSRAVSDPERASFEEARADTTERGVEALADFADLVLNTQRHSSEAVLVQVACLLGLFGREVERLVDVLVGGQYGSEGKGQIAAYLAPEYEVLVRVGGPNAGHRVYEDLEPGGLGGSSGSIFAHNSSGSRHPSSCFTSPMAPVCTSHWG